MIKEKFIVIIVNLKIAKLAT